MARVEAAIARRPRTLLFPLVKSGIAIFPDDPYYTVQFKLNGSVHIQSE
jgi:hypothetical protein